MNSKRYRYIEKIMKGVANHRRIQILDLLHREPELSVGDLSEKLKIDYRTTSDHIWKLVRARLVMKRNEGNIVRHALTNRGKSILEFCRILE